MLIDTPSTILHPAYRGLLALVDAHYIRPEVVARRYKWSQQHLANLRRAGRGLAFVKFGRSVRYPLGEMLAYEIHGQSVHVTASRLALATAALDGYTPDQRADISAQLESLLFGGR